MDCPNCGSNSYTSRKRPTKLGYQQFHCKRCGKYYNERTETPFNHLHYPTDVVLFAIFYYCRFKDSFVDVAEHMALRGFNISHETVRQWVLEIGTEAAMAIRARRKGKCGSKWHMDVTYLWIEGRWCYLYRAIDKEGNLVDVYLSDTRDKAAAEAFFNSAHKTTNIVPSQITTDKEPAFSSAIKNTLGEQVKHRTSRYMNNKMEQDHRGIKSRTNVMKGFKNIFCALRFCYIFEEMRQFFRVKDKHISQRRRIIVSRLQDFVELAAKPA